MISKKMKVLVCDDEKAINHALELKLGHEGFDVVTAMDGEECLTALAKEKFDLLLLDLVLPKKDGFSVLEDLKSQGNKIPVVITSNLGQAEDIKRVEGLGVSHYLIKSNTPITQMVEKVKEVLGVNKK